MAASNGLSGDGLEEGISWLSEQISRKQRRQGSIKDVAVRPGGATCPVVRSLNMWNVKLQIPCP